MHDDEIGQCPGCGANMSRSPDQVQDVNTHLWGLRANAGIVSVSGGQGQMRQGVEPNYPGSKDIADVARDVVLADLLG